MTFNMKFRIFWLLTFLGVCTVFQWNGAMVTVSAFLMLPSFMDPGGEAARKEAKARRHQIIDEIVHGKEYP